MDIDRFGIPDKINAPDLLQELITAPDTFGMLNEQFEILYSLTEGSDPAITRDAAFFDVQTQIGVAAGLTASTPGPCRARRKSTATRHELSKAKASQIIVSTDLQSSTGPSHCRGADHQNQGVDVEPPQFPAEIQTSKTGKH